MPLRPSYATPFPKTDCKASNRESLLRFGSERFGGFMRKKQKASGTPTDA
jgi:hypothetical protein